MSGRWRGHLVYLLVLCLAVAAQVVVAYFRPTEIALPIGVLEDRGYIDGFHPREYSDFYNTGYRWSKHDARIDLPGLGSRGRFRLELVTFGGPAELLGRDVQVVVNGVPAGSFKTRSDWQTESLEFGTGWWGDARVELHVQEGHAPGDSRPLGLLLREVRVSALETTPPALSQITAGVLLAAGLYLLLAVLGLNRAVCGAVGAIAGLFFAFGLSSERLLTATWSFGLALSALGGLSLVYLSKKIISLDRARKTDWNGIAVRRALPALMALAFMLRLGGTTYPQAYVIDTPIHLQDVSAIFAGQLDDLWQPYSSALHNGAAASDLVIPYPPLYALALAPLAALPLPWPAGRTLQGFSALLDSLALLLIFILARRAGLSSRAGLLACLLYAIAPVMLQAFSWGVGPALFGSWTMLLALALWAALPAGLRSLLVVAVCFALALLAYTFNAAFVPVMLLGMLIVLVPARPSLAARLLLAALLGLLFDIAIYYWQFVGPTLEQTLPALAGAGAGSALRRNDATLATLLDLIAEEWPLALSIPILTGIALALLALLSIFRGRGRAKIRRTSPPHPSPTRRGEPVRGNSEGRGGMDKPPLHPGEGVGGEVNRATSQHASLAPRPSPLFPALVLGGTLVFAIFSWVEQIVYIWHKHVWFAAPYLCLAAGVALAAWWRRGAAGRLFILAGVASLAVASFWFYRDLILFGSPYFP